MKTILVLCLLIAMVCARPESTYDTRYDDFDVETLVGNARLLKAFGHCFINKGPCTPEGSTFKKTIPEALRNNCARCTPKQRQLIRTVVKGFQTKTPDIWQQLVKQEDPNGEYNEILTKFISSSD